MGLCSETCLLQAVRGLPETSELKRRGYLMFQVAHAGVASRRLENDSSSGYGLVHVAVIIVHVF